MFYGTLKAVRLQISGMVQGVGYRAWALITAQKLDLDGYVRNLSDGTVELLICGDPLSVQDMIDSCWHGPEGCRVDTVLVYEVETDEIKAGFQLLPTI